jgi:hypothetical protein
MSSQGMNLQFREPTHPFCSGSLLHPTAGVVKPTGVLTIASSRSATTELLRRETGEMGQAQMAVAQGSSAFLAMTPFIRHADGAHRRPSTLLRVGTEHTRHRGGPIFM